MARQVELPPGCRMSWQNGWLYEVLYSGQSLMVPEAVLWSSREEVERAMATTPLQQLPHLPPEPAPQLPPPPAHAVAVAAPQQPAAAMTAPLVAAAPLAATTAAAPTATLPEDTQESSVLQDAADQVSGEGHRGVSRYTRNRHRHAHA